MLVTTPPSHPSYPSRPAAPARSRSRGVRYLAGLAGCAMALLGTPAVAGVASSHATPVTLAVTSLQDSGVGSLRWAINSANASGRRRGAIIDFDVAGVISLVSALPAITVTPIWTPRPRPATPPAVRRWWRSTAATGPGWCCEPGRPARSCWGSPSATPAAPG